ncbi:hypothetical protein J1614_008540 [Plenodomus biglobosus]|nr:hypothetical protein J1614_008540 [Plenodomus biglobosus]
MPLSSLFSWRSVYQRSSNSADLSDSVEAAITSADSNDHKSNASGWIAASFRKIFSDQEHEDSAHLRVAGASIANDPVNASGTQPQESQVKYPMYSAILTKLPSNAQQSHTPSPQPRTTSSAERVAGTPNSLATTPPTTAGSIFPESRYGKAGTALQTQELSEHDLAMAAYAKAEEILAARHAGLQVKPDGKKNPKSRVAMIIKKATKNEVLKVKRTRTKDAVPSVPHPAPASRSTEARRQPRTAGDAAAMMQRRDRIMRMTYGAVYYGCDDSIEKLERLITHFDDQANGRKPVTTDIVIGFGDYHLRANDLGDFERTWIARYNALCILKYKQTGRALSFEDYELLAQHFFPADDARLLTPEYFDLFLEPLAEEGVLTKEEFLEIRDLGVTQDELDSGATYTPPAVAPRVRARQAANSRTFRMPKRDMRTGAINLAGQAKPTDNLDWYLRLLVEAAVYKQTHYRGFFFGDAAFTLNQFYQAYQLSKQDRLLPPELTEYNRLWTYAESRLLERGQLLCKLLKKYEAGTITDFGLLRIVRATLVQVPGQPGFRKDSIQRLLYDRVVNAGILIRQVPEILALLPDNDAAFSSQKVRQEMLASMNETALAYEAEETDRMAKIKADQAAFAKKVKKELGVWGRIKRKAKGALGRKKKVEDKAFNPFSPEHKSSAPIPKDDGSFYA